MDRHILRHRHNVLVRYLPGRNPVMQCSQGSLIAMHTGEMVVGMKWDRKDKAWVMDQAENKGISKFLGENDLPSLPRASGITRVSPTSMEGAVRHP